ncbi:peptidylprolyl isomerase [Erythrobacteraceae bacterium CFH 75059]|uniref:FKBP-type peptidyl-prolyl cis-trans isomerase n=1 Tax=Qipengyuania thermophila TaxID=2509361 RepID=UPI001020C21F|nr:FKBP-type peptidyl-prolyl cis-trans isomerase [Qipengyuania thermophila]TCD06236.1 peptidylprolyl isomerase [Erythrobacteraceae bacterium CFH 75059]
MTEITRVPLQPLARGSRTKLWLAIAASLALAGGVAVATVPRGLQVETLTAGTGARPSADDVVFVRYRGTLADTGEVFDESQDLPLPVQGIFPEGVPLPLSNMIPGFRDGLLQMQKGGRYRLEIPSDQAYGPNPQPGSPIPPNADLVFEVELIDFMPEGEFQQRLAVLRQLLGQGHGAAQPQPEPGAPDPRGRPQGR